jgi:hypothetical protein
MENHIELQPRQDPGIKTTVERSFPDLKDDIFSLKPHMSCNRTQVIREHYQC